MNDQQMRAVLAALQGLQTQVKSLKTDIAALQKTQAVILQQVRDNCALLAKSQSLGKTQAQQVIDQWHALRF